MKKPDLLLAANAFSGRGGQGQNLKHMIDALVTNFDVELYSQCEVASCRNVIPSRSRVAQWMSRTPFIRRMRGFQSYLEETYFDEFVARELSNKKVLPRIVQGVTGQCSITFMGARKNSIPTTLDMITTHVNDFEHNVRIECEKFGVQNVIHPLQKKRILNEIENVDLVRAISFHVKNTFLANGFPENKIAVVYPPVELNEFPDQAQFREPLFRVSFVGLLEPWKGFQYLIEAFQKSQIRESELVLWGGPGSGPVSRYLHKKISESPNIKVNAVSVRDLGYGNVYSKSSVLVHPTLTDGFGYVVAEAMASGIPVIVTSNAGSSEWVREGVNGFVVPPRDTDAIADRLKFLSENPAKLREMGIAARESVKTKTLNHTIESWIPRLKELL